MGGTIAAFVIFTIVMIGVGVWGMKRTTSIGDFVLGGREIGPWLSALSYGTAYFSAVVFIGFAGKLGWGFGLDVLWIAIGNVLFGAVLAWLVLGRRTRRMSHNLQAMTMPEFFEGRYGSPLMKLLAAFIIFIFLLPYSAGVFKGLGHLFEVNLGVTYTVALIFMSALTGIYLVLGGYKAASRTDFIQGTIMFIGSIAIVVTILSKHAWNPGAMIDAARQGYVEHLPEVARTGFKRHLVLWSLVFMTSFGTWGLPQLIQKYYAIKDEKMITRGAIVTGLFALVVVVSAYFIGAMTHAHLSAVPNGNPDQLVPALLKLVLPGVLMGLVLLLILSASMSTLASLILVSASAIVVDVAKVHLADSITRKRQVLIMRALTVVLIIASVVLALMAERGAKFIVDLIAMSWGTVAGAFMAPYIYGLFWRRTTKAGAMAGMLTGMLSALILFIFFAKQVPVPVSACIAMILPFAVVPIVSLMTRPPEQTRIDRAFRIQD